MIVTQLSFLGLCSYYRKFIYSFEKLARPLNALTENKPFVLTMECNDAFQGLKSKLMKSPVLSYPDPKGGEFVLDTDASNRIERLVPFNLKFRMVRRKS